MLGRADIERLEKSIVPVEKEAESGDKDAKEQVNLIGRCLAMLREGKTARVAQISADKRRAFEHKMTPVIGRSHGIHAEPVTFGLKLAQAYAEFTRCRERLVQARKEVATCASSGAVGPFANVAPAV